MCSVKASKQNEKKKTIRNFERDCETINNPLQSIRSVSDQPCN